jgi:hypothetical protein
LRHEEGVRGRIDLGARLGPGRTAHIWFTTRGVLAVTRYAQSAEPTTAQAARFGYTGGWLGRLLNAFVG